MGLTFLLLILTTTICSAETGRIMCLFEQYLNNDYGCTILSAKIVNDDYNFTKPTNINVTICAFYNSLVSMIPSNIFHNFLFLVHLKMEVCRLSDIKRGSFKGATKLKIFNGNFNMVSRLDAYSFIGAETLEECLLHSNLISFVDENAFKNLKNLKQIVLSKNRIETLDENTFLGLESLEHVSLHTNQIMVIKYDLFQDNSGLKSINLARNKIYVLSDSLFSSSFSNSSKLMKVDLSWNICINKTFNQNETFMLSEEISKCSEENSFEARILRLEEKCSGNFKRSALTRHAYSACDQILHNNLLFSVFFYFLFNI